MHYGYDQGYGNFHYGTDSGYVLTEDGGHALDDGLMYGSLPALNIDYNTLQDGFTWYDYLAAKSYTDGLYINGQSYDGHCVYREEPDPSAAPTAVPVPAPTPQPTKSPVPAIAGNPSLAPTPSPTPARAKVTIETQLASVMSEAAAAAILDDPDTLAAYNSATAAALQSAMNNPEFIVYVTRTYSARRRRGLLQATTSLVSDVEIETYVVASSNTESLAATALDDVTDAVTAAVTSGDLATALQTELAASGNADLATASASVAVDETATLEAVQAASYDVTVTTPLPTYAPSKGPGGSSSSDDDDDDGGAVVIIIIVVVLVVVLAAGGGAFFMMKKGGGAVKPTGSY